MVAAPTTETAATTAMKSLEDCIYGLLENDEEQLERAEEYKCYVLPLPPNVGYQRAAM